MIEEIRRLLARSTQGTWFVTYTPMKEPRIESTTLHGDVQMGYCVVPASYTMTGEDAELIVAMQRNIETLMAAVEAKEAERVAAVIAMERANNEHMEALRKMIAQTNKTQADIDRAMAMGNELSTLATRQERELAAARAKVDRYEPLIAAVDNWVRSRFSPRLLAAWDRYTCAKSGS